MTKTLSYFLTPLFYFCFGIALLIFHPVQWLCFRVFGYNAHRISVAILNLCLMRSTAILGTTYDIRISKNVPKNKALIFVSNHQSMYDIPPFIWSLRAFHPKFVSKKELGKGIPSVSYNLRHGGSVLIDRKDTRQALSEIGKLGKYIEKHQRSAVIFPEGTRSRDGHPKAFKSMGVKILCKNAPSALLVPVSINNSWKLLRYGKFPYGLGVKFKVTVHDPIPQTKDFNTLFAQVEETITNGILHPNE